MIEVGSKWREIGEDSVVTIVQVYDNPGSFLHGRVVFRDSDGKDDATPESAFLKYFERVEE